MYKLIQMFHAFVMFAIIQYIYVLFQWYIIIILLFPQVYSAKLLQKSEMRKDIVIELSYKGFG